MAALIALIFATWDGKSADLGLFLGRFHPLVVHLPIGLTLWLAFAETASLAVRRAREKLDPSTSIVLGGLVVTGIASLLIGHLLGKGGGYPSKLIGLHKNLALGSVLFACVALATWSFVERSRIGIARWAYRGALFGAVGTLSIGAHYGGSLTHGDDYLSQYAPGPLKSLLGATAKPSAPPAEPAEEPLVFAHVVAPILEERCVSCHGSEKQKGRLRVDSLEALLKGGEGGPGIIAGDPKSSLVLARMLLPAGDEDRMPPDDHEPATEAELAVIQYWIERGALAELKVRDTLAPEAARPLLDRVLAASTREKSSRAVATSSSEPSSSAPKSLVATGDPITSGSASSEGSAAATIELSSSSSAQASSPAGSSAYAVYIAPVLADKCGSCHSASKKKGGLAVDSVAAILAGGKAGPGAVPGSGATSLIVSRCLLPADHDDHMPPASKPQMDRREIDLVSWWIDQGASASIPASSVPEQLRRKAGSSVVAPKPKTSSSAITTASSQVSSSPTVSATVPPVDRTTLPAQARLYEDIVKPLLEDRCTFCHGGDNPSGGLKTDDVAALLKGGDSGPAVVKSASKKSLMVKRMLLPAGHDDRMPPDGSGEIFTHEIDAIRFWIDEGLETDVDRATAKLPESVARAWTDVRQKNGLGSVAPQPSASASSSASASPSAAPSASATQDSAASSPSQTTAATPNEHGTSPTHAGCASCSAANAERDVAWFYLVVLGVGASALALRTARRHRSRKSASALRS